MKRGRLLLSVIVSVISIFSVFGIIMVQGLNPDGITWLSSSSLYEFETGIVNILFLTPNSDLVKVNVSTNGMVINDILEPNGCEVNGNVINCDVDFQILSIDITPVGVDADQTFDWGIKAIDSVSGLVEKTLRLTVKNDLIVPVYVLNSPSENTFVKNGSLLFDITVTEEESGLDYSVVYYDFMAGIGKSTPSFSLPLNCIGNDCASSYATEYNNQYLGFYFEVVDKAGNKDFTNWEDAAWHYIYVDSEAPVLTINTADPVSTNSDNYDFNYDLSENTFAVGGEIFNPEVDCSAYLVDESNAEFLVGSEILTEDMVGHNLAADFSEVEDKAYQWYLECADSAGWTTTSTQKTIIIDRQGPEITWSNNQAEVVNSHADLLFEIVDALSNVNAVWWETDDLEGSFLDGENGVYALNSEELNAGENNLQIHADDSLGNANSEMYTIFVDNEGPAITLDYPVNNALTNSKEIKFTATDDYSSTFDCDLYIDESLDQTVTVTSGLQETLTAGFDSEETHSWRVECLDDVGNAVVSEAYHLTYDNTLPAVTLDYPRNNLPYDANNTNSNGISDFNYTANDLSGVTICQLYIGNHLKASGTNNFLSIDFSGLGTQNNPYTWEVRCNDNANNQGNASGLVYFDAIIPGITSVSASADSSSAVISWQVDETTDNIVYYGTNSSDLVNSENMGISAAPSGEVSGLSSSTLYFYLVQSCDQFWHCVNSTEIYNFTTAEQTAESSPPSSGGGGGTRIRKTAGSEEKIVTQEPSPKTKGEEKIPEEALAPEIVCDYALEVLLPETISFLKQESYEGEVINKGNCGIQKLNLYSNPELSSFISFSPATITDLAPGNKSKFQIIRRTEKREWPFSLFTSSAIAEKIIAKKISGTVILEGVGEEESLFTKDLPVSIEIFAPEKIIRTIKIAFPSIIFISFLLVSILILIKKRKRGNNLPESL